MGRFEDTFFTCPTFIKDGQENHFASMVEAEHVITSLKALTDKYEQAHEKASKENATEEQIVNEQRTEEDLRKFEKAVAYTFPKKDDGTDNDIWNTDVDFVACLFAIAFGLEKSSVNTDSFERYLFNDTLSYNNLFYTMQKWTDARKQAFKELKDKVSNYVDALFNLKDENSETYEKRTLSLNSKDIQMYLDKSAPTLKKTKVKNNYGEVVGIAETYGSAKACVTFLLQTVFYHHGCAVTKAQKKTAHISL